MLRFLRVVLVADGVVLCTLGLALLMAPHAMWTLFGFVGAARRGELYRWHVGRADVHHGRRLSRWPRASRSTSLPWVWAGIIRGLLEAGVSLGYFIAGLVTFQQVWAGPGAGGLVRAGLYRVLPRRQWLLDEAQPAPANRA